jgi:hypothetical protein
MKEELSKDMENFRQKNQAEILEIKIPLVKEKTQWKRSLQQTRTGGRQNFRT